MDSFLLYILKSTICISLLYLPYRFLMRKEAHFALNRVLLFIIIAVSAIIPLLHLPQLIQSPVQVELIPDFSENEIQVQNFPLKKQPVPVSPAINEQTGDHSILSLEGLLHNTYLAGVMIGLVLLIRNIVLVLFILRRATVLRKDGSRLLLIDKEIPSFAFAGSIIISKSDYEFYGSSILPHEKAHIRLNHFYDLLLLELVKVFHWFNPAIYGLIRNMKEIHEFQADEYTLHSGIDATQYQLLIIQKCVGPKRFALANSFNHCPIKKRIAMMNKQKTGRAWRWKVATFLPLLAFLLMAFGKNDDDVPVKENTSVSKTANQQVMVSSGAVQNQNEPEGRVITIKNDGNYIGSKLCSLQEIVQRGQEWKNASNKWIHLQVDESIPYSRVDEVREALHQAGVIHVTQSMPHSDEIIYPVGDVSKMVKFSQGKWGDWVKSRLDQFTNGQCRTLEYSVTYCFVIDKNGKVSDGRIVKPSAHTEINTAVEKMLAQIPDWEPAKRGANTVNVLYTEIFSQQIKNGVNGTGKK